MSYVVRKSGSYNVALSAECSQADINEIIKLLGKEPQPRRGKLSGRGRIVFGTLKGVGSVVLKKYQRGGMLRHFMGPLYLGKPGQRALREFEMLEILQVLGLPAARPVAAVWQGGRIYSAWLITRRIENYQSLADMDLSNKETVKGIFEQLSWQLGALIRNRIIHSDFHPGNVLVDGTGRVHIIDFDKASFSSLDWRKVRDQYALRWRRAVIKHELPEELSERLCLGLRGLCPGMDEVKL